MTSSTFALEINESLTRIAAAHFKNGVVVLEALGTTETTPGFFNTPDSEPTRQKQAQVIMQLKDALKITQKIVHVVIPDTAAYAQVLETPILAEADLVSSIRYQADEFIPMRVDETYMDLEVLRQDDEAGKLSILIVAAARKVVDGVYRTLELAGLEPGRLETEVSAVSRLVSEVMKSRMNFEGYCILNFGYAGSSIYVIDSKTGALIFHRSCKIGMDTVIREVMTNLNIEKDQILSLLLQPGERRADIAAATSVSFRELSHEVERISQTYTTKFNMPIKHIFTINFSSYISDFNRLLAGQLSVAIESLPLKTVYIPNPVFKTFDTEITGFASTVSTLLL
jgi:type IV pilus assembly protein PilM